MKKLMIALMVTLLLVGCQSTKKNEKTYVIGMDDTFAPMGFKDEQGNYTGFDVELAKAVGDYLGVEFTFKSIDWNSNVLELNSKKIDLIWNGMTITDKRISEMAISDPYYEDTQALYVLKDSGIKTKEDLKGKVIGIQLGSSADEAFAKDPISASVKEIKRYQDNVQTMSDLKAGRLDAVVLASTAGDYYIAKTKETVFLKLTDRFAIEYVGIGARKEDTELIEQINQAIQALKDNGEYQKIYDRWFKSF